MPTIKLYANLRTIAGAKELSTGGTSLGAALERLFEVYPALEGAILENGRIRPHVVITINGHNAADLDAPVA